MDWRNDKLDQHTGADSMQTEQDFPTAEGRFGCSQTGAGGIITSVIPEPYC